ncbi:class I SAM-dependent methyltransferase [Cylindrospermopsis raciborskii]|uniref:class I SAM-dependent methyltransferase n=1 Tax=Cylindrospermopsis raciborskii TaxID=77022 RepID=UPI001FD01FC0|nr:class I SAM-dependent methyltransferase [Cylindrospermopsis raciborskii]
MKDHQINPLSICEVGCGSGDILRHLHQLYPNTHFVGYDISPQAAEFWESDAINNTKHIGGGETISFVLADFHENNTDKYDVLLMLDVFEHVRDPFTFLEESHRHADRFVFHIPLDLSASSVLRGKPLLEARDRTGHLHFYTKDLALTTLRECGFKIIEWRYTGAALNMPNRSLKTNLFRLPRYVVYAVNKDWGTRLLGGETLIVLAE